MASIRPSLISPDSPPLGERAPSLRNALLPLGGIVIALAIAWSYLIYMTWAMENMDVSAGWWLMPRMTNWDRADLALVFAMWAIMMAAMMLPSALPLLSLFAQSNSQRYSRTRALLMTSATGLGYVGAWGVFSALA